MVKIVTIGGGSSYTPELVEGFIKRFDRLPIKELWLVDVEDGKEKVEIVGALAQRMFEAAGLPTKVITTLDRAEALKGADFVTTQLRVGQLEARKLDERIPNSYGYLGQETNGAGGMFKALRTIPVILDIVNDVEEYCPNAFIINFTNPAGIVSEAVNRYTDFKRFIGVCNVPIHTNMDLAKQFNVKPEEVVTDFLGLNHMVFGTRVLVNGEERTTEAIEKILEANSTMKNIHDLPWNDTFIRTLGLIPCSYHRYFYKKDQMVAEQLKEYKKNITRAEQVMEYERELFAKYKDLSLSEKPKELEKRGGAYYSDVACDVLASIYNNENKIHTVNIKNNGHVKNIEVDDTIEITCRINRNGAIPLKRINYLPREVKGIYELYKSFELKVCEAAIEGSYEKGLLALNLSPFTQNDNRNEEMYNELLRAHSKYIPWYEPIDQ